MVSDEKSAVILIVFPISVGVVSLELFSRFFSMSLALRSLTMMCLVDFFQFILFKVLSS